MSEIKFSEAPGSLQLVGSFRNDTGEARAYRAYRRFIKDALNGRESDSEVIAEIERANADLLELRDVRPGHVHQDSVLSNLSVMYTNGELVNRIVAPEVLTGDVSGIYFKYGQDDKLDYPDDSADDRTDLAEINQNIGRDTYALAGKGLKQFVDANTIRNQEQTLDVLMDAQENVLYALEFKSEQRAASYFQTNANYGANVRTIAAGTGRWDNAFDAANGVYTTGDPQGDVTVAKDALWSGNSPGRVVGLTSLGVFNVLKRHKQIVEAIKYGGGPNAPAVVTKRAIAEFFGLDDIVIGAARYNTAQAGQSASYGRLWGNHFAVIRVVDSPSRYSASFAYTFREKATRSDTFFQPERSTDGGYTVRSSRFEQLKGIAPLCGYRIETPVA